MATTGSLIYIYSNDGLTQLTIFYPVMAGTTTVTITNTGAEYKADNPASVNAGTYTYSGDKVFIGLATSANATEPTYAIGDKFTFPAYASSNLNLYIVEQEQPEYTLRIDGAEVTDYENVIINGVSYKCKQVSIPTDLTGYIVTVPAGWSAPAGYGRFKLSGYCVYDTISDEDYYEFYDGNLTSNNFHVGYSSTSSISENSLRILYNTSDSYDIVVLSDNSKNLQFFFDDEEFDDASNQSLIQWLVDNNATFKKTLISFTIDGTSYQAEAGMTWGEWVSSSYNTGGFRVSGDAIVSSSSYNVLNGSLTVDKTDAIIANQSYRTSHSGGA